MALTLPLLFPATLLLLLLLQLPSSASHKHGIRCGVDHKLHAPTPTALGQSYATPATWSPMRVTINAELLEGKADPRACHGVGQVVDPCDGREQTSPASCPHNCTAANVVTASKAAFVKARFGWLRGKVARLLKVNPVTDEVTFRPSSRHLVTNRMVENTDLVIILHMRPHESGHVSGYAGCLQKDQFGRCTVGYVNLCPEIIDPDTLDLPEGIMSATHTALHETMHILGAVQLRSIKKGL